MSRQLQLLRQAQLLASATARIRPTLPPRPIAATSHSRPLRSTAARMGVHNISSKQDFQEAVDGHKLVVVDAFATWCGPCKAIAPIIATWSNDEAFKDVYFSKFDVDALPDLAQELEIEAMPTFLFYKDGAKVDSFLGGHPPSLKALIEKHKVPQA